jgi:anti-anti-sigma factor
VPLPSAVAWYLHIERTQLRGVPVMRMSGRLGVSSAGSLRRALMEGFAASDGSTSLVVDLDGVDYMSSAGLEIFESVALSLGGGGGELILCGASDPVRLVLRFCGPRPNVVLEDTLEAAIHRALTQPAASSRPL